MTFDEILAQVRELLQREQRLSYRALKRRFALDDGYLEGLKAELVEAKRLAVDEDGRVLVWTGGTVSASTTASPPVPAPTQAPLAYTPSHLTEKILAARRALEGERKQVSVFFADIKDSTRLIEGLDPEGPQRLLDPAIHIMMDAVHRYEGTVNQVLGDGIMALFGAPIAHEDHALRGEVWGKALAYCRQAGEKAMARSAHREAVGVFEQALSALQHLPEQRATCEQAIDLRLALRSALLPSGDWGRILASLREAESLAEAFDDPRRLGQVSGFLSFHFHLIGAHDQAIAAGQRALALATADEDVIWQALANQYLGYAYESQGAYRRAIDCFGQTVASLDGPWRYERFGRVFLPAVTSRAYLAWCHAELGAFAQGRALGEEGLRIAEAVAHPASLMMASWGIGLLSLHQGNLHRALPLFERAVSLCQDTALPIHFSRVAAALGVVYTLSGRVADAVPLLTQVIEEPALTDSSSLHALCRLPLGEAQVLAVCLEGVQALAEREFALARTHQERGHQAYALRLLGDITAQYEPPESEHAGEYYRQALALAEELGMRPLMAHCHLGLGTLYGRMGVVEPARAELTAAIALYRAMDMTFWLPQAEVTLAEVGGG